jgi:uncharacterized membrane protein
MAERRQTLLAGAVPAGRPVRRLRGALAYALLVGLVGAGIVHIVILLLVPQLAERNAWARFAVISSPNRTVLVEGEVRQALNAADPAFQAAACRFDLSSGPVQVTAQGKVPFWSASVYDRGGRNLYSLNDRSGGGGALDLVMLTPEQMTAVRQGLPEAFTRSVFVEVPDGEGMLVVRAFASDSSFEPAAADFLRRMRCGPR